MPKCLVLLLAVGVSALAQETAAFQKDFPPEEFQQRRARIFDQIGTGAIAIVQGAPLRMGFQIFRQTNEFYHLCGLEAPHAYLAMDGRTRRTTLFLAHRDEARERNEGKLLAAEDAALVKQLTGVDDVLGIDAMARMLSTAQVRMPAPVVYTPFSPSEGMGGSRDETLGHYAEAASDPWDGDRPRTAQFISLLRDRFPTLEVKNLTPILDEMRLVKSPREIALIRRASEIAAWGILEAMRSTKPGAYEYQLDAAARYTYLVNGARHEGYPSITGGGTNAWYGHYSRNDAELKSGDLVLMDYAPDYRYYTSDVTRMWPVNGKYTKDQLDLVGFILSYRGALLKHIRPGVTADQIMNEARADMEPVWKGISFSKEIYRKACEQALSFRGHLSHPVGLTVHDVGNYRKAPLVPGMVFSIDPMIWVPEEKLYVRMEDVVVVTANGVENFTDFLVSKPDEIEKVVGKNGIVQQHPAQSR